MIDDRKVTFSTISNYLAQAASATITSPINLLLLSSEIMKMNFNNTLNVTESYIPIDNFINARTFQTNPTPYPLGFDESINKSFEIGM